MKKIRGIKSVDILIEADGHGIINWNGSFKIYNSTAGQYVENHTLPKLRGVDPTRIKYFSDLEKSRVYVSQNCVRHYLFRNDSFGLKSVNLNNVDEVLCSLTGLLRGFVIAEGSTSLKRKSALLLEDFLSVPNEKDNHQLNYEQFSKSGERNETSIHSRHTTGDIKYRSFASINIEDLQFIPLEDSLNRSAFRETVSSKDGQDLAEKMTQYLKELDFDGQKNPQAEFHINYRRINAISPEGEAGILLNQDAIDLLIQEFIERLESLHITQGRGRLTVTNLHVDYNDGSPMRIKTKGVALKEDKEDKNYAVYYEKMEMSADDFKKKMKDMEAKAKKKDKNKDKKDASEA